MRVLRVLGVLEPGGAQLSALRLSRAQAALGVETRLVAGDATPAGIDLARQHGVPAEAFAVRDTMQHAARQWLPDPDFAAWLRPYLDGVDLVHAHMFGAWWAVARVAPADVPLVASEHNAITWPLGDATAAAAEAAQRVDAFFAHGPAARDFAASLGIAPPRLLPGRSAIAVDDRPRPGLAHPRLTFTGRMRADKGPDLLLNAIARLTAPVTAYLVGDGPMTSGLRDTVDALGLARVVHLPGWSHAPSRYVAGASVHVVPSREEAWSQSAVTGLALGVPVVGTAVDGLPHTLGDGRGILVPPEDPAALAAAIDGVLRGEVTVDPQRGRRYARQFEASRIAASYFDVYLQLLGRGRPATVGSAPLVAPTVIH